MLSENIKNLRKQKGLTQEEMAIRLNVVRQTVSKWEKGISVPDVTLLETLADVLDTAVGPLLGKTMEMGNDTTQTVEQLARISEQLAIRNRRWRVFWKVLGIGIAVILAFNLLLVLIGSYSYQNTEVNTVVGTEAVD